MTDSADAARGTGNGGGSTGTVRATGLGTWPGTDPVEANRIIRGELGAPNLPHLAELPGRGVGSDAVGRTAAVLVDLPVDVQPFGWRLVDRPGQDHRRAVSALRTDLNVLADLAGAEDNPGPEFKLQLRGPLSLAAALHLHNGERALLDAGARREIAESLAAGAAVHAAEASAALGGAAAGTRIVVQLDEPDLNAVLAGTIPTSSGYRTLRAVSAGEVRLAWDLFAAAVRAAGVGEVVLAVPAGAGLELAAKTGFGVAVPAAGLGTAGWESLAVAVEADRSVWVGLLDPEAEPPQVTELVTGVLRPWRQLGLPDRRLGQLTLTPATGLAEVSPARAKAVLHRLSQAADALNQVRAEA